MTSEINLTNREESHTTNRAAVNNPTPSQAIPFHPNLNSVFFCDFTPTVFIVRAVNLELHTSRLSLQYHNDLRTRCQFYRTNLEKERHMY